MWLFAELLLYISNLMSVKCNADDNTATYLYRLLPHYYGMSRACFLFRSTCLYMTFNYLQSCNIRDIFECRWDRIKCYEPLLMIYGYGLAGLTLKHIHICDVWLSRCFPVKRFVRKFAQSYPHSQTGATWSMRQEKLKSSLKFDERWGHFQLPSFSIPIFSSRSSLRSVLCSGWTRDPTQLIQKAKQSHCHLWSIVRTGQLVKEHKLNPQLRGSSRPRGPPSTLTELSSILTESARE